MTIFVAAPTEEDVMDSHITFETLEEIKELLEEDSEAYEDCKIYKITIEEVPSESIPINLKVNDQASFGDKVE
jgi:hypothetical protein